MASQEEIDQWSEEAANILQGRTIVAARYMNDEEMQDQYWDRRPVVMVLDDGTKVFPAMDDEGNDAGALFGIAGSETLLGAGSPFGLPVLR